MLLSLAVLTVHSLKLKDTLAKMRLYYRGMAEENDKPKLGRTARTLGVRVGDDLDVVQMPRGCLSEQGYILSEIEKTETGELVDVAIANGKGLSVSLSIEGLPPFRKPPEFGGKGRDPLWQIESEKIPADLEAIQDGDTHVSLCPRTTMLLDRYETALASTRNDWSKVVENGVDF